ncbi:MAG: RNA pseudouridine synthase [Treponema sp.]|jgi:23S rRNA pseudouridine1911/1915/1917 synthase|nr:RNA pseudouridine synthase [Treponema sp.]
MTINEPYIIDETPGFAVVFKPPRMHSAPIARKEDGTQMTLFEWFVARKNSDFKNSEFKNSDFKNSAQSSVNLMHRLDFDTHGLVLFAKNAESFEFFKELQDKGGFIKEYSAICAGSVPEIDSSVPGFPPTPVLSAHEPSPEKPLVIESYFRPFGPGRKLVRPVIEDGKKHKEIAKDNGGFYRTEIININKNTFTIRLKRGFRHQIRCHLCWIGFPIQNDPLYPRTAEYGSVRDMALQACALFFADPLTGKQREYRISPFVHEKEFNHEPAFS